ncbi:hypothetical protein EYR40_010598 [Pleurotus pulmonarius]|nr:hypothetical protein EYR40_010598 [Pleurotus pulmonarius]
MIRFPDQSFRTSGVSAVAQQVAGDPRLRVHEQLQATPGLADIANRAKELAFRSESCVRADQIISLYDQRAQVHGRCIIKRPGYAAANF